jgi:omega-6 fatty acid desaturase (delta-12 desaturase)
MDYPEAIEPDIATAADDTAARRPTVPEVRGQVPVEIRTRSTALGLAVFSAALGLYALSLWGVLASPWWPLQVGCALANGVFIGTIFVVGHDACHGSLTPLGTLNQCLGRISFLPALTPYISWEYAHNRVHHSYTNLRCKDYAWAPFSKAEYDQLSPLRRALERHYRSLAGLGTYYLVEYWWKHLLFPSREERRDMKRPITFLLDRLLVAGFAAALVGLVLAGSQTAPPPAGFWSAVNAPAPRLLLAVVLPFLLWNWAMGFAIFQHHNHPRIPWYDRREEWDFFAGQVESTVHIQMPWWLEWPMAHIMQHTAHHVDPKIPLYRLAESQRCLERAYPEQVVVECWSLVALARNLARCQLYDYDNHRWLNFAGRPTTEPNPLMRALREGTAPPRRRQRSEDSSAPVRMDA